MNFYKTLLKVAFGNSVAASVLVATLIAPAWAMQAPKISSVQNYAGQITIQYQAAQALLGLNVYRDGGYVTTIKPAQQQGREIEATLYIDVEPVNAPDVYLFIGQSNMEGASERFIRNSDPGGPGESNPRIRQLNVRQNSSEAFSQNWQFVDEGSNVTNPRFITAEYPLHEPRAAWVAHKEAQFIGPGLSFAKAALSETTREVYLVPAAWSASGFCDNGFGDRGWNAYPTDAPSHSGTLLADRALSRLNMTLRDTGGILRGILWHQGEADSNNGDCAYRYEDNLRRLAERFRGEARGDRRRGAARGSTSNHAPITVETTLVYTLVVQPIERWVTVSTWR